MFFLVLTTESNKVTYQTV